MSSTPTAPFRGSAAFVAAALAMLRPPVAAAADPAKLLVFLHVAMKQRALQSELERLLPTLDVSTVGRVADMDRGLAAGADALLSLPAVLKERGLSVQLQGYRKGTPTEPYSLVAVGMAPRPDQVISVGALDILGRVGTNLFVKQLLGVEPKVTRVTKVEDLLPLLQMQRVEAVLLPERLYATVRETSRLALVMRVLDQQVGLPAVATLGNGGASAVAAVKALGRNVMGTLGVDEWR